MEYDLQHGELEIIVEALRIQRERWQDVVMRKAVNDPSVSEIDLRWASEVLRRHEELLKRLPSHGLST
ncbi:MAG: hypothetical protein HY658_02735 [Actinobacteria bacterium]|nr:hypothetical protein [Actinomycetota bacterium]